MQTLLDEGHFTKSVRLHHHSECWIGKQQNLEPYFHFIFSSWYEGSSARESVTGYLTNLFEDLDISGDLKKLQRNNYNDDIFPDQ